MPFPIVKLSRGGVITLSGRLPKANRAAVVTVSLAIGRRGLWTKPDESGRYAFSFSSSRRILWVRVLVSDARGRVRHIRSLLALNITAVKSAADVAKTRDILADVFDRDFYLAGLPPAEREHAADDPLGHYIAHGARHGWSPHRWFDVGWYAKQNPAVIAVGRDPFEHYLTEGWKKDRHPHPDFDNTNWLARHPGLLLGAKSPLHSFQGRTHDGRPRPIRSRAAGSPSEYTFARPYPVLAQADMRERIADYRSARGAPNHMVAFTVICGAYDTLRLPEHLSPDLDYVVFSDQPLDGYGVFEVRPLPGIDERDPARIARHVKLHPHQWFPNHDVALFFDANVIVRGDMGPFLSDFVRSGLPLAFVPHPARDCIYEEAVICAAVGKDDVRKIVAQMRRLQDENYPYGNGLVEANIYACRPGDSRTRNFFDAWWRQLRKGSRRDQLSANYVLWKQGLDWHPLLGPGHNTRNHPALALLPHGTHDAAAYADLSSPGAAEPVREIAATKSGGWMRLAIAYVVCWALGMQLVLWMGDPGKLRVQIAALIYPALLLVAWRAPFMRERWPGLSPTVRIVLAALGLLLVNAQLLRQSEITWPIPAWTMYGAKRPEPLVYTEVENVYTDGGRSSLDLSHHMPNPRATTSLIRRRLAEDAALAAAAPDHDSAESMAGLANFLIEIALHEARLANTSAPERVEVVQRQLNETGGVIASRVLFTATIAGTAHREGGAK